MPNRSLSEEALATFAAEVRAGLTKDPQKELPSKYLYDDVGTALFEVITLLPEYGVSRAGERLLVRHAAELAKRMPGPVAVAELGSGTGKKTRRLLEALTRRQKITYYPIDISAAALERCRQELGDLEAIEIVGLEATYTEGLSEVSRRRRPGTHLLVLFLGGTIGNFDRPVAQQFLSEIRKALQPQDGFLLSADLEKPVPQLLAAYDDSIGVTAAFNLNILSRLNRELEGDFILAQFEHVACYDEANRRIEMHLRSKVAQTVTLRKAGLTVPFRAGETIWTESSHRFNPEEIVQLGARAGFRKEVQWVDEEWPFAQTFFLAC